MIDYRVNKTARLARGVVPGAFTVIEAGAVVGEGATIGVGCYIGPNVTIGEGATIGPHAVILTDVPAGVTIPPNTTLGSVVQARATSTGSGQATAPRGRPRKVVK